MKCNQSKDERDLAFVYFYRGWHPILLISSILICCWLNLILFASIYLTILVVGSFCFALWLVALFFQDPVPTAVSVAIAPSENLQN